MVLEPSMRDRDPADAKMKIGEFVKAIARYGPDVTKASRSIGVYNETARYWYKKKLLANGFAVQAAVAYEKLGLKYVVMVVDLEDEFEEYAKPIFWAMSELCYVRYYNRTLPGGSYIVHAIVPEEHVQDFSSFFSKLRENRIFRSVDVFVADWHRNVPMRVEFFDFGHGVWDIDWGKLAVKHNEKEDGIWMQGRVEFDRVDLEILKQMQMDAAVTGTKIAARLQTSVKNIHYHHRRHVMERGLIRNYRVNWLGTRYDYKLEKAMHRKHRQLFLNLLATGLTESERMEARAGVNQFPCLWAEASGEGFYYAEIAFPSEAATEGYEALARILRRVRRKYTLYVADHMNGIAFTLNPKLYDSEEKAWKFSSRELLPKFEELALKIRRTSS
jgi:DNA-binding Lrp family transcriptional regulator